MPPSAASSAGRSTGLQSSLASARQRRREDRELEHQRGLEQAQERRADEAHELNMRSSRFGLERARTEAQRADEAYARDMDELRRRNMEEGVVDFVNALQSGVDPRQAMQLFNSKGTLKLTDVQVDPASKRIRLVDSDGEMQDFENPRQIAAAFGVELAEPERQDLIDTDKPIYDPNTNTWREPPGYVSPEEKLKAEGEGGGRDTSPYNPQTVQDDITAAVVRSMGGQFDAYGRYSFGSEGDRQLGDYRIGLAQDMAGRLEPQLKATRVTPGAIVNAVMEATRDVPSESQLVEAAEQWRTKGPNKSQEDAAKWLSNERRKARAKAEQRLADLEQKLLTGTAQPSAFRKPEWAKDVFPLTRLPPEVIDQLNPQEEYDIGIDGRKVTIRFGPDGQWYEVKGKGQDFDALTRHHNTEMSRGGVRNSDGTTSTVRTIVVNLDGKETIIPTVWDGKVVSDEEAIRRARASGKKWPQFDSVEEAEAADRQWHESLGLSGPQANIGAAGQSDVKSSLAQARRNKGEFVY